MSHAANIDLENASASEDVLAFAGFEEPAHMTVHAGFSLVDDAEGRFVIDSETGVVSVAYEDLIERERNVVHGVRIRVVERNGDAYELAVRLKITGFVPKLAGDDFFGDALEAHAGRAEPPHAAAPEPAPQPFSAAHWARYAAFAARQALHRKRARFHAAPLGEAVRPEAPAGLTLDAADLACATPPLTLTRHDSDWPEL